MQSRIILATLIVLIGLGGCGIPLEENSDEDQERAHEVLLFALDAWKDDQIATLAKQNPPVRFGDDDQLSGLKLQRYELKNPLVPIHPFRDVAVILTLLDSSGKSQVKPVTYQVGLDPSVTVLRSDN